MNNSVLTARLEKLNRDNLDYYLTQNALLISQEQSSLWLHKSTFFIKSWFEAFQERMSSGNESPWVFLLEERAADCVAPLGIIFLVRKKSKFPVRWGSAGKVFGSPGPLILSGREIEFLNRFIYALKLESRFYFLDLAPTNEPWIENVKKFSFAQPNCQVRLEISELLDAPYIELVDFQSLKSRKLAAQLARTKRNFARDKVSFEHRAIFNEEITEYLETLYLLHEAAWPKSIFNVYRGVYRDFLQLLCQGNTEFGARLDILLIEGSEAALVFGIVIRDRYYYLVPTYSSKYANFSPGSLLILEVIEDLKIRGVKVFDFMNSLEPYKLKWTSSILARYKYIFFSHMLFSPNLVYFWPRFLAKFEIIREKLKRRLGFQNHVNH
jgi:hypothetical protein